MASALIGQIQIPYFTDTLKAESANALRIYKWNNGWVPLETRVDMGHHTVSSQMNGPGYFAAFLSVPQSSVVTGLEGENKVANPARFRLYPIYPNPFSSNTSIRFELPVNSKVTLEIFDMYGRKVATLLDKSLAAGDYTEIWNCKNSKGISVSPGVYICLLRSGSVKLNQKMVVKE